MKTYLYNDSIGSCELLDSMGSDLDIVNAARVSFNVEHPELSEKDETRHAELLTLLETRLTERLTEKRHPLHKPNPHKKRRRSRKRGPRKEKG